MAHYQAKKFDQDVTGFPLDSLKFANAKAGVHGVSSNGVSARKFPEGIDKQFKIRGG